MPAGIRHLRRGKAPPQVQGIIDGLRELPEILGIALFGSTARGDADEGSDVDVLVVRSDSARTKDVRSRVTELLATRQLEASVLIRSEAQLAREVARRPSFAAHLIDEGVVLHESASWTGFDVILSEVDVSPEAMDDEIGIRSKDLRSFADIRPFNGHYFAYLANLYAIGRSVVIARLLARGVHEYRWRCAFSRYSELRPDLKPGLEAIEDLRPFYEYACGRRGGVAPMTPTTQDAEAAYHAVAQLTLNAS